MERTSVLFSCNFLPKGSKKLGPVNHIQGKKVLRIRASPKVTELWMGDYDHPSIISQQGASCIVDATLNPCQTCPSHYSNLPPLTMTSFLRCLNLQAFLNVRELSLVVH